MTTDTDQYLSAFGKRMSEIRERGSIRAAVKRGAVDLNDLTVNPYVYRGFPDNSRGNGYPSAAELAFRDTLCLYASLASGGKDVHTPKSGDLGKSLSNLAYARGNLPSQDTRTLRMHNRMVSAKTREEIMRSVTEMSKAAIRGGVGVDFFKLARDLRRMYSTQEQASSVVSRWSTSYSITKESAGENES